MRIADKGIIEFFTLFTNSSQVPITTADGKYTQQRTTDNKYWDGGAWQTTQTLLSMTKIGDANSPGLWKLTFNSAAESPDTYLFVISDDNGNAANSPQKSSVVVGDALAKFQEFAAAAATGKAVYDPVTSILTLTLLDGVTTFDFNMKDVNGNAAGLNPHFEKVPV